MSHVHRCTPMVTSSLDRSKVHQAHAHGGWRRNAAREAKAHLDHTGKTGRIITASTVTRRPPIAPCGERTLPVGTLVQQVSTQKKYE
jgi:hypothetical protein